MTDAIQILRARLPRLQFLGILTIGAYVLINLIIDITYTILDPRIRY